MKRRILATFAVSLLAASMLAGRAPAGSAESVRAAVPDLLALAPDTGERFRVLPLSETLVYAVFESVEDRAALLEGVSRQEVPELDGSVPVWISDDLLAEAFADVAPGGGPVDRLRDALVGAGVALPPRAGRPTAAITTVVESSAGELFDFSMSRMQEGIIAREENLDQLKGNSAAETASLKFAGADHPTVALFEPWRFDELPDALGEKTAEISEAERVAAVRRARFEVEVARSLFHVDLFYEDAVLEWLEGLDPADVNLLARLLQIAGLREITPQILVRQGTPMLWEPSVLRANLYGALERVSRSAGRKGGRRLDRERFASDEVFGQASAFYAQFFAAVGPGELKLELLDPVGERIDRWAQQIREITTPFVERHLAGLASERAR